MEDSARRAIAIVGLAAILPDARDARTFWQNVKGGRYSIDDVPPGRWDPVLYYDPDPAVPDKTYSKLGGWVRAGGWEWDPLQWRLPIPPRVADAMDEAQKWAVACARALLLDYGSPERALDLEHTAVVVGTAMAGEKHYETALRIHFPAIAQSLGDARAFASLSADVRGRILEDLRERFASGLPPITEDTMPGELANCLPGRIANLFDLHGPNFTCDAACASALAAMDSAIEGLVTDEYDAVLVGGVDRNMGPEPFVKFSKIGALSATGTRPFADGADGFVMGEGAAFFLLKRLADAERNGDRIYAVIRGVGGASDGKGKGITAPNPVGQRLAIERAWKVAGVDPASVGLIEGHGTSTRVGDVVEVQSLSSVFGGLGLPSHSVPLGSVKSNIGHLKGAAGAAGLLKAVFALHEKQLPPSLHFERPNPAIDFESTPFFVNTELKPWDTPPSGIRRAGVSAFGFGGTNFHVVLEEYVPHRLTGRGPRIAVPGSVEAAVEAVEAKAPLRGALVLGAPTQAALGERLARVAVEVAGGILPPLEPPAEADLRARERIAIDWSDAADLSSKLERATKALDTDQPMMWKALRAQGVFRGRGEAPRTAFLYTGQGSQYVNMLRDLRAREPIVAQTFAEADRVMTPILGRPLTDVIFVDPADEAAVAQAEESLRRTEITQPAVLAVDAALTRLLASYGIAPDLVMGHSLGEYGALVAAGALSFEDALQAVAARGREMAAVSVADKGRMAAVFAPIDRIRQVLAAVGGDVVIANLNSTSQAVIGGATAPVERAIAAFQEADVQVVVLPVSHAFHTPIVASVSEPLRRTLERLHLSPPEIPLVGNVRGDFYPMGPDAVPKMLDLLAKQVASPVQFVRGLHTLHEAGARVFVEVGPKRALHGFTEDVLGSRPDVLALFTNHPKSGDVAAFNQALCGLYASGLGVGRQGERPPVSAGARSSPARARTAAAHPQDAPPATPVAADARYAELGRLFAEFLERGSRLFRGDGAPAEPFEPVGVTGVGLGLPGRERIFDGEGVAAILDGEQEIDVIPSRYRQAMVEKHITRLVKSASGDPHFETIESPAEVIKIAARGGALDLEREFGISADRVAALDTVTRLAMAAGIEALRDAGIPLVLHYRTTHKGTHIPERWMLPDALRDDTGVVFASAFPGYDSLVDELNRFHRDRGLRERIAMFEGLVARAESDGASSLLRGEIDRQLHEARHELEAHAYEFDRRFLFRVLAMAHAQFAEHIGARGPNTHVNSACASTTQAFALAEDWIRAGRCRRVAVIAADDVTSDTLLEWMGAGFLATGAAATDEIVEQAALPFDRRRHGMILGMGAAGFVIESASAARERGLRPICEVLSSVTANSAFHGTRLDPEHIAGVMERLVAQAEARFGLDRTEMARELLFVSHETYTPARGGSASAEVNALRRVFGDAASRIVVANTKGFTGHAMGVGVEDAVAVKALETGIVPPVPNYREPDPELGSLNLSRGGVHPIRYALRLGAGFGSQISMSLLRWVPTPDGVRPHSDALGYETRIESRETWLGWLRTATGAAHPELEVVHHTLRVVDRGAPAAAAPTAVRAGIAPVPEPIAAPATPPVPAPEPIAGGPGAGPDPVLERVLELVAEKTGYPRDMLDLDLDLEADLGIDTVKQAETFAAIREAWDIPRDENLKLRDYPTLEHVVRFVRERRPDLAAAPAAPAAAPAHAAAPAPAEPAGDDGVAARVLAIVSEKTGYPSDMLELDLDLEADLGIDTVKQAETLAAIREAYGIPRDENLKLRDYPTLEHVIAFVHERLPAAGPPPTAAGSDTATAAAAPPPVALPQGSLDAANRIPRRVPVPVLRPPRALCKPTGVALEGGRRVIVRLDEGGVGRALAQQLEARGVETLVLEDARQPEELARQVRTWRDAGPIHGIYWLPALDAEPPIEKLDLGAWRDALRLRVKDLYATMRTLGDAIDGGDTFLVSATRLGGRHGYDERGAVAPMGGGVVGFSKAFAREKPDALVKVVDFGEAPGSEEVARALVDETLRDPGAVELGIDGERRVAVGLVPQPAEDGRDGAPLGPETVFAVTGAAGGIVSAIVADLAAASGGAFHLIDVVPEPDPGDPDLERFRSDRDGLVLELRDRLRARGERGTPVQIERELGRLERANAALAAIEAVRAAGGDVRWHAVDLLEADAVARAVDAIREQHGRIDVLLHAAGLERSRALADKEPAEFDLVFDVKCDGWFNLLHAIGDMPLSATVAFSSIAGRFGNAGQTDYSAANDLLCKFGSWLHAARPATRAIAIDWTAWGGLGMATRGSIPEAMQRAGIDMLPPEAGIATVRRELAAGGRSGELVVAERLGILLEERDPTGGLDPRALADAVAERALGPMLAARERPGPAIGFGLRDGLRVTTGLDPHDQPFLDHHRIDGTPVLPGAMGLEAFAEAASLLAGGLRVAAIEDVEFLAPFKFYRDEPREVELQALLVAEDDGAVAHCRLVGRRELPGIPDPQETTHFRARVRLRSSAPALGDAPVPGEASGPEALADDIYRIYFHGPAYQVLEAAWRDAGEVVGRMADGLPENHWPPGLPLVAAPRLVELCFQTAGIFEIGTTGKLGLPQRIARIQLAPGASEADGPLFARATPRTDRTFDALVVDGSGAVRLRLEGYETIGLPDPVEEEWLLPIRAAMA